MLRQLAVVASNRRLVIWCGAGISRDSGLPLASELTQWLFKYLPLSNVDRAFLLAAQLPFELILQTLQETTGSIELLLDTFTLGTATGAHRCIADLAAGGQLRFVVTTNFDSLIEQALQARGLVLQSEVDVFVNEKAMRCFEPSSRPALVHIHGSIRNRSTIAATLEAVSSRTLHSGRARVIEKTFHSQNTVLVLGYSWSDAFDISPLVARLSDNTNVVLIMHHASTRVRVAPLSGLDQSHPLVNCGGAVVSVDTRRFLDDLALEIGTRKQPNQRIRKRWITQAARRWAQRTQPAARALAAGNLLRQAGGNDRSGVYLNAAARLIRRGHDHHLHVRVLGAAGNLNRTLGLYDAAAESFRTIVGIAARRRNHGLRSQALRDLATVARDQGNLPEAHRLASEAIRAARKAKRPSHIAHALACRASLLSRDRDFRRAAPAHLLAAKAFGDLGEPRAEGAAVVNAAEALINDRRYKPASRLLVRAISIATKCGDPRVTVAALFEVGRLFRHVGDRDTAVDWFRLTRRRAQGTGQRSYVAASLANIAGVFADAHETAGSARFMRRALKAARTLPDGVREEVRNASVPQKVTSSRRRVGRYLHRWLKEHLKLEFR